MNLADIHYTDLGLFDGAGMTRAELAELDAKMWRAQTRIQAALRAGTRRLDIHQANAVTDDLVYVRRESNRTFFAQWGR
jgi:hypothetical protein